MSLISRGFQRRREAEASPDRVPPGQYVTSDFPVLSAGPTPRISLDEWRFRITTEGGEELTWSWQEFSALPSESVNADIHCVTKWSKLDTAWQGVSIDYLLRGVDSSAAFVTAHSYGGYTTNLPLVDLTGGKAWVAFEYDGQPLAPEHGGPARLLVPISISGRAPSGSIDLSCATTSDLASGNRWGTTSMETRGKNSGTRATELAPSRSG